METATELKATLSTTCQCQYCPTSEVGFYGDYAENCPECGGESDPVFCNGDCWDYQTEGFAYLFEEWEKANNAPRYSFIEGSRMGWRGVSGHTDKLEGWEEVLKSLTGDFDFTLRCEFDPSDNTLTIVRSSHDEMGALFTVQECLECWYCGNGIIYDEVECKWTDLSEDTDCFYTEFGHFPVSLE